MSHQGEVNLAQPGVDFDDVEIVGSDEDVAIIDRDDVSNYNPENILPEPPEIIAKIRQWLGPTDYNHESGDFRKHLAAHMPGTGQWLFAKPNYQKWHDGQDNGLLWIKGIPGSGKSVFAATLIDELSREGRPVLFFFFRQIIEANHKPVNLLRDWLDQILEYSPPLQAELKAFVDERSSKRGCSIDTVNIDDLWKYLKMALVSIPRVYLVVDALDEMDKGNNEFLQALAKLGLWKPSAVKVIITSRPVNSIEEPLRGVPVLQVRLEEKLVDGDIAVYVQRGIDASAIPAEDRQLITEAVPGRANGLFLYAKLAMDAFLEPNADIRQVLGSLPSDLNDMYTGLLQEHARRSGVARDVQMLILSWVTHATRPLRLIELAEFVRTSHVGECHLDLGAAKNLVRAACGPLLELLSDETISVIHHSLTEFLNGDTRLGADGESSGLFPVLTPAETHERLAVSCLRYLLAGCLDGIKCEKTMHKDQLFLMRGEIRHEVARLEHPSLTYAVENWFVHASKATNDGSNLSPVLSSSLDEFLQQGPRFDAWLDLAWHPEPTKDVTPCHVVARYGLTSYLNHFVRRYPSKGAIDARDAYGQTPLFLAASEGHAGVVKILIAAGANPDAEEHAGLKPLHQAAKANHVEVARALVEAGVCPLTKKTKEYPGRWCGNSPSTVGDTPLMYVCEAGHLEVLEVFLPSLVDSKFTLDAGKLDTLRAFMPHLRYDYGDLRDEAGSLPRLEGTSAYYQALGWASVFARSKLVTRLLQHPGIELETETYGRHAFRNACRNGDIQSMEAIFEAGVIPTPSDLDQFLLGCSTAWSYTQRRYQPHEIGIDDIKRGLDLFLRAGVPIERCNLHFAAESPLLLRLLLQAGADPNFESEDGTTLLHRSLKGEVGWEIVVLLVEEGKADVNRQTRSGGKSPLQAQIEAVECHVDNCIRYIERYHPDCTLTDQNGRGPLTSLVRKEGGGFVGGTLTELAEKLVAAGASLNQHDHSGKTALHYAQKMEIVALLVRLGADINARDHSGTTRLMDRLRKGLVVREIDEMIALGARLELRDFRGRTLLHQILPSYSSKENRNHLIALGMDLLATDYSGNTLLHELVASYQTTNGFHGEKDFLTAFTELKDLGINPNAPNTSGQTVLHMLITKKTPRSILTYALEWCELECVDNDGFRPIHLAAKISGGTIFSLIAAGADPFPKTHQGKTTLHLAAESQDSNTVGILLDILGTGKYGNPSDIIDSADESGRTALYYACKAGRPETVALLLGAGATLNTMKLRDIMDALLGFHVYQRPNIHLPWEYELDSAARGWPREHRFMGNLSESETVRLEEIVDMLLAKGLSFEEPKAFLLLEEAINQGLEGRLDYNVRCMRKLLPATWNLQMEGTSRPSFRRPGSLFSINSPFTSRWADLRDKSCSTALHETKFLSSIAGKANSQMELMMGLLRERQFDLVGALFEHDGFDPLLKASNGKTPLHALVSLGYWRIVQKVVRVDKLLIVESLESLIRTACERSLPNMEVLRILVERLQESLSAHGMARGKMKPGSMGDKFTVSPLYAVVQGWWQVRQALPFLLSLAPEIRPDLEVKDPSGTTPLIKALQDSGGIYRKEAANLLIEAGANVNATYKGRLGSQTCLSLAGSDLELVRLLLKHGATVTGDALFGAIESRNEELMELFLSSGADPNMRQDAASSSRESRCLEDEHYPLYRAATKSSEKIVRQLLDYGADPFAKYENFPLQITSQFSHIDGDGADTGDEVYKKLTVLHEIIKDNGLLGPFFEALPNLDLEHQNEDGETLLLAACHGPGAFVRMVSVHGEDKPLGEILLERGANTHAVDNLNRNALHLLLLSIQNSSWWNVSLPLSRRCFELLLARTSTELLSQKADGDVIPYHQHPGVGTMNTPLHLALQNAVAECFARVGYEEGRRGLRILEDDTEGIIDLLLEAGADPLASNGEGDTALHMLARGMERRPISRRLFEKFLGLGLDINVTNNAGETPLFVFVKSPPVGGADAFGYKRADYEAAWRVFVDKGADFQARDNEGRGLLHAIACLKLDLKAAGSRRGFEAELSYQHRVERFKRLMGMGLDPFAQDKKMRSSLDVAVACGDDGILQLFKEDGSQDREGGTGSMISDIWYDD